MGSICPMHVILHEAKESGVDTTGISVQEIDKRDD